MAGLASAKKCAHCKKQGHCKEDCWDLYPNKHPNSRKWQQEKNKVMRCYRCDKIGHITKECRNRDKPTEKLETHISNENKCL